MIVRLLRILTAGVIFLSAAGAQAQVQDPKLWYVSLGTGGAWYEDVNLGGGVSASTDTGFTLNGAFGRYIDEIRVIRLEGQVLYNRASISSLSGTKATGTLSNTGLMVNAYYDFRNSSNWTPYMGGGIGYSRVDFDKLASAGMPLINDHDDAFSYQLMLGVAYEFSPAWAINVGYRFYATDNLGFTSSTGAPVSSGGTKVHNADIGVRFNF